MLLRFRGAPESVRKQRLCSLAAEAGRSPLARGVKAGGKRFQDYSGTQRGVRDFLHREIVIEPRLHAEDRHG
jgi:hypothetical protein